MNRKLILNLCIWVFAFYAMAQSGSYQEEREFYETACTACHEMQWHLWPRSYKSWELTVENMRNYVADESVLDYDDCRRITSFLTTYAGEGKINVPDGVEYVEEIEVVEELPVNSEPLPVAEVERAVVDAVVSEPLPVATIETRVELPVVAEPVRVKRAAVRSVVAARPLKRLWNPGRGALKAARISGFIAVVCLIGLLVSGFGRRKLKLSFRRLHVKLALGLFLALAAHGIIYLFEYGTPNVLWYWFGFVGLLLLIVTELQGIVRKRFRRGLLISHIIGACAGLAFSILHWVWAWL